MIDKIIVMILIMCVISFIMLIPLGIMWEILDYNNGKCPNCKTKMRFVPTGVKGWRTYCCDNCSHVASVTYWFIDKK